jgi:hypothetical protein
VYEPAIAPPIFLSRGVPVWGYADDQHSDHQHRIDRWAANRRVVGRKLCMHSRKVQHSGDLAHAAIIRDDIIEAERIEKLPLVPLQPPPSSAASAANRIRATESRSGKSSTTFATKSALLGPAEMSDLSQQSGSKLTLISRSQRRRQGDRMKS